MDTPAEPPAVRVAFVTRGHVAQHAKHASARPAPGMLLAAVRRLHPSVEAIMILPDNEASVVVADDAEVPDDRRRQIEQTIQWWPGWTATS